MYPVPSSLGLYPHTACFSCVLGAHGCLQALHLPLQSDTDYLGGCMALIAIKFFSACSSADTAFPNSA